MPSHPFSHPPRPRSGSRSRRAPALLAAAALLALAGCGGTSTSTAAPATSSPGTAASAASGSSPISAARTSYPLTFDNCGVKVTFAAPPTKVVILNGTSVAEIESFLALGIEGSVIANSQSYGVSDDPTMVERIKKVPTGGLSLNKNFDVPAEQVLALKPDLVVSTWSGGFDGKLGFATREQLAAAGIRSLVNPVNCANGKPDATEQEKAVYKTASVKSSFEFLTLLGQVFDVQGKAASVVADLQARIDAVHAKVKDRPTKSVLIAFPAMAMATTNGVPAVFAGGISDDVVRLAGGVNAFEGKDNAFLTALNTEALAAAKVDVLALGAFTPQEKPEEEAATVLAKFPSWQAALTKTSVTVSDGVYLGPANVYAIEKLAKVIHPDAF